MPRHRSVAILAFLAAVVVPLVLTGPTPALAGDVETGRSALEDEKYQEAADAFRAALEKDAQDLAAAVGLARAVIGGVLVDDHLEAEEALHAALEKNPKDRPGRLALGDLYLAMARSKVTDTQAMKFLYEDAKQRFRELIEDDAKDEDAVVGMARAQYESAMFDEAVQTIDDFLSKAKSKGAALYWKGQVRYLQGLDAYRRSGKIDDAAKALFEQARGAYAAATVADPKNFDAWMQLGYAAQYLWQVQAAQEAYEKAMDLDPQSFAPLRGIEAVFANRAKEYPAALGAIAKAHPDNVPVHFYIGYRHLTAREYDDAIRSLQTFARKADDPSVVWVQLGKAYEGKGEGSKAEAQYYKALEANADDRFAAASLDSQLQKQFFQPAKQDPKAALGVVKAYAKLFEAAPRNVDVRNNAAFILRDAADQHPGDARWRPVVEACAKLYVDASEKAEASVRGVETTTPFQTRYMLAQVLNDTGLMYQYYPSIEDLEKAEEYYLRALELSEDGYKDTFANLAKMYMKDQRWDDLYELATASSESIVDHQGNPLPEHRAQARQVAERLVSEGKVESD